MSRLYNQFKSLQAATTAFISITFLCMVFAVYALVTTGNYQAFGTFMIMGLMYGTGAFSLISDFNDIETEYKNGL